jgi:hypothetical protein
MQDFHVPSPRGRGPPACTAARAVSFEKVDANGDGYISQSEFQGADVQQVDHSTLDADNDGRLNRTEFAAFERMGQVKSGPHGSQHPEGTGSYQSQPEHDPDNSDSDY